MDIAEWWADRKRKVAHRDHALTTSNDEKVIAMMIPELSGMGSVNGAGYIQDEIEKFDRSCTPDQSLEFTRRLELSQNSWLDGEGHEMPWWGSLLVLRKLHAEIAAPPSTES